MVGPHYLLEDLYRKRIFLFESFGPNGTIPKMIIITELGSGMWNLGFGDLKNGKVDDISISNNADLVKVMNTVAKAVYVFMDENPRARLSIKAVDEKRLGLYHTIFRRHFLTITTNFNLYGVVDEQVEPFFPGKTYHSFQLERKFES